MAHRHTRPLSVLLPLALLSVLFLLLLLLPLSPSHHRHSSALVSAETVVYINGTCPVSSSHTCMPTKDMIPGAFCTDLIASAYDRTCAPSNGTEEQNQHNRAHNTYTLMAIDMPKDDTCVRASKSFVCYHYFPRCSDSDGDGDGDAAAVVLGVCQSACQRYYTSCSSAELIGFRCLDSEYKGYSHVDQCSGGSPGALQVRSGRMMVSISMMVLLPLLTVLL